MTAPKKRFKYLDVKVLLELPAESILPADVPARVRAFAESSLPGARMLRSEIFERRDLAEEIAMKVRAATLPERIAKELEKP